MQEPFRKKKKYGQNFLIGNTVVKRIVAGSGIDADCGVLEIGPGAGALTRELLSAAKRVVSVEIDGELIPMSLPCCASTLQECRSAYVPICRITSPHPF